MSVNLLDAPMSGLDYRGVRVPLLLKSLARRPLVLVGLMLLAVGVPEVVISDAKTRAYQAERVTFPPRPARPSPTELYPQRSAADEKLAIVDAKISYYQLLRSAGRLLVLLGLALIGVGFVRDPVPAPSVDVRPETSP